MALPALRLPLLLMLVALILAGCSRGPMIERIIPEEDRALAQAAIQDLQRGDTAALAAKLTNEAVPQLRSALPLMRSALPPRPHEVTVMDGRYLERTGGGGPLRRTYLAYEIAGGGRHALVQIEIVRQRSNAFINSMQISALEGPASSLDAFTFRNTGVAHWLFLVFVLAAPAVTIAALVRVWRSGLFRRRWLWTLGCLVGVTQIVMNWSTGDILFQPLHIVLLSASIFKPALLAPWIVSFSLPVVAIWALARARRSGPDPDVATTFD